MHLGERLANQSLLIPADPSKWFSWNPAQQRHRMVGNGEHWLAVAGWHRRPGRDARSLNGGGDRQAANELPA
jgi:hypothetical protein